MGADDLIWARRGAGDGVDIERRGVGAKELEEGIAIRASDIDTAWINGYGFPAHLGGPMYWGAQIGLDKIHAMALKLGAANGPRWMPGEYLTRLVERGPTDDGRWAWA